VPGAVKDEKHNKGAQAPEDRGVSWQDVCQALWGADWIAPLAEVLAVNRRTVERWRSGAVRIPDAIIADLTRLSRSGPVTRAYGDVLRRIARGETVEGIEAWMSDYRRALARYKSDAGRLTAIPILASPLPQTPKPPPPPADQAGEGRH